MSIYVYCDAIFYQMEDMRRELGHTTSAVARPNVKVGHLEDQIRESNKKVYIM
jgi:hypothetical protein